MRRNMNIEDVDIGDSHEIEYYSKVTHRLEIIHRSSQWPDLRRKWLVREPQCQCCNKITKLQVHHIRPVHLYPELELDENNLITLCENPTMNCHFIYGHCLNWLAWNRQVMFDVDTMRLSITHKFFNREENEK
jgi:5-methylcytosine-specific restriction enzyme A